MKTNYLRLLLLICGTTLFAQNNDFNNQGGDFIWSNPANWSQNAIPLPENTVRLPILAESQVDQPFTVTKVQTVFATSNANPGSTVPLAGSSILTIDAGANNFNAIENVSNNDAKLTFKGNVTIDNSAGGFTQMRNLNGTENTIEFGEESLLTINTNLASIFGASPFFNFNGTITGSANLRLGPNTISTFGSTSSNPDWDGQLVFQANATAVVNAADNNEFFNGEKIQVNGSNSSIEINGENTFNSGVTVGANHNFTFTVNKSQNAMTKILLPVSGTLNLVIGEDVELLHFQDTEEIEWGEGTLNIVGYEEGVIRFGTDNTALTAEQLAQINADNGDEAVALDSEGFLVNESSLSVVGFDNQKVNPILISTISTNYLNFTEPQNAIQVIDLNGKVLVNQKLNNELSIDISSLQKGNYFVIFEGNRVERFIKK